MDEPRLAEASSTVMGICCRIATLLRIVYGIRRMHIAMMMIQAANVLIFDEPTNHLDMESITALNNGLIKFPGVILFSCHDHQFVQTTANRIMEITPDGLIDKMTTYDEYLESDASARKRQINKVTSDEDAR